MKILVLAEHDTHSLKAATYHTVTAAQQLGNDITLFVIGENCAAVANEASHIQGVKHVLVADAADYAYQLAENTAPLIAATGKTFTHILAPASTFGKNILPRVAALLDVAMVSDIIKIISADEFIRPIHAGNALATVQDADPIKIISVRSTAFEAADKNNKPAAIEKVDSIFKNDLSEFVSEVLSKSSRPELTSAKIIISGGRGLKSVENFKLLEQLADKLGAAVGATRAAVDAGFAPNDFQVGQTGKVVAPDLYIAIGISGAIQHIAGMKDSKVIIAINNDPEAAIFQIADYGLVMDLFTALKELPQELDKENK